MDSIRPELRLLLSDRRSPEARALFERLMTYVTRRVQSTAGRNIDAVRREEVVADVMVQLISSALAAFRGNTLGELIAYVRTATDRTVWRNLKRSRREAAWLREVGEETAEDWSHSPPAPDAHVEIVPQNLLNSEDSAYLRALLTAGSKADFARSQCVSRAAVTLRVQRIKKRVAQMGDEHTAALDGWLRRAAREVLAARS